MTTLAPSASFTVSASPAETNGANRFAGRALRGYAAAIAAEQLATDAKHVDVTLSDDRGLLAVHVSAPVGLAARGSSVGIVERVDAARVELRTRMQNLTGRTVGRVDVTVTRRTLTTEPRVK